MLAAFKKNPYLGFGALIIFSVIVVALLADHLAIENPNHLHLSQRYASPSFTSPFGRDENGSDVFTQILLGSRISLSVAVLVAVISTLIGLLVGSLAGFSAKWLDLLIMRLLDIVQSFPNFLLALGLVAVLGPSIRNLVLAMCFTSWAGYARLVRGEVLHLKEREYVLAVKALGQSRVMILLRHIWPNLAGPLVVHITFSMAGTIIAESGLSFLGLGAPIGTPTWGNLLNSGRKILLEAPHVTIFPALAILWLVLGFNLFGDGLRHHFDSRQL